jgi:hypothetical protein
MARSQKYVVIEETIEKARSLLLAVDEPQINRRIDRHRYGKDYSAIMI